MPTYGDSTYGTVGTYTGGSTHQPSASEVAGTTANVMGATGTMIQVAGGPQVSPLFAALMGGLQVFGGIGEIGGAIVTDVGTEGAGTALTLPVLINGVANIISGIGSITGALNPPSSSVPNGQAVANYQCNVCAAMARILAAFLIDGSASATLRASLPGGGTPSDIAAAVWATPSLQWSTFTQAQLDDIWAVLMNLSANHAVKLDHHGWFVNVDDLTTGLSPRDMDLYPNPANILPADTVLSWLTREIPGLTWTLETLTQRVKGTNTGPGGHAVYCTLSGDQFEWLKNYMYTPSSGPPKRSLVADWDLMFAMIPINY